MARPTASLVLVLVFSATALSCARAQSTTNSALEDDLPVRSCYFEGKDVICPICASTEVKDGVKVCTEWIEEVNPSSTTVDDICIDSSAQCGSRNDTAFPFNPERDNKTESPCCTGLACKTDPFLSVGALVDAFFCTNCTKPLERCSGETNQTYIDYAPCCFNATTPHECVPAPELGSWGNFCVPAVPLPSPSVAPTSA